MNRRDSVLSLLALGTLPLAAKAQQAGKVWRIGYLSPGSGPNDFHDAFREGLRDLGYIEGRNLLTEYRWAAGKEERLPEMAAELVALRVDIIVTVATQAVIAAKRATGAIPIIMTAPSDAVASGLVASLARPGGNVTGLTFLSTDLAGKRLQLLRELLPKVARVAVLATQHRLPTIIESRAFVDVGGLMSYGPSLLEMYRRSAHYVDRIFKGAKPADLPVEQPNKFEMVINLNTAKALGLTIPQSVLAQADEVIR